MFSPYSTVHMTPILVQRVAFQRELLRRHNLFCFNRSLSTAQGWYTYRCYRREWLSKTHPHIASSQREEATRAIEEDCYLKAIARERRRKNSRASTTRFRLKRGLPTE